MANINFTSYPCTRSKANFNYKDCLVRYICLNITLDSQDGTHGKCYRDPVSVASRAIYIIELTFNLIPRCMLEIIVGQT